jgi:hypothetical protein
MNLPAGSIGAKSTNRKPLKTAKVTRVRGPSVGAAEWLVQVVGRPKEQSEDRPSRKIDLNVALEIVTRNWKKKDAKDLRKELYSKNSCEK